MVMIFILKRCEVIINLIEYNYYQKKNVKKQLNYQLMN